MDVGAHVGQFSLLSAELGYRVEAFEPFAANARLLRASCERNGMVDRVRVHQVGVGEGRGKRVAVVCDGNKGVVKVSRSKSACRTMD